jgi:hypothetical protein
MKAESLQRGEKVEGVPSMKTAMMTISPDIKDYEQEWNLAAGQWELDTFALLDVSSNANQMGVSFLYFPGRMKMMRTAIAAQRVPSMRACQRFSDAGKRYVSMYPGLFVSLHYAANCMGTSI